MTQKAEASGNSTVIQSGQDTHVGYSAADMKGIIESLSDQLPKFAMIAHSIVEERLRTFEEKILTKFSDTQIANANAFESPDFQFSLGEAQKAFCRFGDQVNVDVLVDLLASKSKQENRDRLSLCLGQAVEKIAVLTENELAALALNHLFKATSFTAVNSLQSLGLALNGFACPMIEYITDNHNSFFYMEANGVSVIDNFLPGEELIEILRKNYAGAMCLGHDTARVKELFGENYADLVPKFLIPCVNDKTRWQANAMSVEKINLDFRDMLDGNQISRLKVLLEPSILMTEDQFIAAIEPVCPRIRDLFSTWNKTPIRRMRLTPVGTVIGHARLQQVTNYAIDLGIWVN
ncbi:LPO_1073/Vpar_1526 family protein [Agrobacterium tumefaciens]|uniref:LPO_1073/Vpar_1526 family protein n=1 Tax=Agrobacterium tumefaciens TaxID=358 RepID=UPI0009781FC3|nr:hypothetical protein [Agrobacterium tumefaciens]NSZ68689.1 hypothetical protein [Agrobacterium tumefaciens]OMP69864.1 hypothetical protein BV900_22475 [Agrobacterium tumefaciens]